jgi:hypothetical protein
MFSPQAALQTLVESTLLPAYVTQHFNPAPHDALLVQRNARVAHVPAATHTGSTPVSLKQQVSPIAQRNVPLHFGPSLALAPLEPLELPDGSSFAPKTEQPPKTPAAAISVAASAARIPLTPHS